MEMEKPRREIEEDESDDGVGRSYECSYCKRGFTNAQALGGHMNIHRKDKAKAKAKAKAKQYHPTTTTTNFSSYSSSFSPRNDNYNYIDHQASLTNYSPTYLAPVPQRNNYQAYGNYSNSNYYNYPQFANCNPRSSFLSSSQPSIYFGHENFSVGRSGLFGMYEEPLGANLSLRTGESNKNEDENNNYDAIDLELRLGYDP